MENFENPKVVCSAFIKKDDRFLMVYDPRFKMWRVPGGRVQNDERLEETLLREMKEELNVDIKEFKFLGFGQDEPYKYDIGRKVPRLIMFFLVTEFSGDIKLDPEEAQDSKWLTMEEIKNLRSKEEALMDFFNRNPSSKLGD